MQIIRINQHLHYMPSLHYEHLFRLLKQAANVLKLHTDVFFQLLANTINRLTL